MFKKNIALSLFLTATVAGVLGCTPNDKPTAEVRIPLIRECEEKVVSHLNDPMWTGIEWEITRFSNSPATMHMPHLTGFITVRSSQRTEKDLKGIVNGPIFRCYPTTSVQLTRGELGDGVTALLRSLDRTDAPENYYFVLSGENLQVFYLESYHRNR